MVVNCTHHWYIETPHGDKSQGVCKYCGEKKLFNNSFGKALEYFLSLRAESTVEMDFERMMKSVKKGQRKHSKLEVTDEK